MARLRMGLFCSMSVKARVVSWLSSVGIHLECLESFSAGEG